MHSILQSTRAVLILTVVWLLSLYLLFFAAYKYFPFQLAKPKPQFFIRYYDLPKNTFEFALSSYDTQLYRYLVERGYEPNQPASAFYPLYPVACKLANVLFGHSLLSGMFVSALSLLFGMALYMRVRNFFLDERAQKRFYDLALLLAFPSAFYFGLMYTESMFFAVSLMWLYGLKIRNLKWAALAGFLMPLCKGVGLFMVIPNLIYLVEHHFSDRSYKPDKKWLLLPFASFMGISTYFLFMYWQTGDMFTGFNVQVLFGTGRSAHYLYQPWIGLGNVFHLPDLMHTGKQLIDQIMFIIYVIFLFKSRRWLSLTVWTYMAIIGLIPILSGTPMSFVRYVIMAYPILWFINQNIENRKFYLPLFIWFVTLSGALQVIFMMRHLNGLWVA